MKKTITTAIIGIAALFSIIMLIGIWLQGQLFKHANVFVSHQSFAPHHRGHGTHHFDRMFGIGHQMFFPGDLFTLFLLLAVILTGIILWKTTKKGITKWMGVALIAGGLFMLLPKIIFIPVAILAAYFMLKAKKNDENMSGFSYDVNVQSSIDSRNADFLDQWEKKIKTEE